MKKSIIYTSILDIFEDTMQMKMKNKLKKKILNKILNIEKWRRLLPNIHKKCPITIISSGWRSPIQFLASLSSSPLIFDN